MTQTGESRGCEFFTIGHSNHALDRFLGLLEGHAITAVADVRSVPYSRRLPHFDRPVLQRALAAAGIAYVFLGNLLGGRPKDPSCYRDGKVDYALIAATPGFGNGLARLEDGTNRYRIVLMCAERDPLDCHRALLVSRHLAERGAGINHILADGSLESHEDTERRLRDKESPPPLANGCLSL